MTAPYWLNPDDPQDFPDVSLALTDPDGLLALGGDLSTDRLLTAYAKGIFPWYSEGQPVLWWSPDPRAVLFPEHLHISKSLAKTLRKNIFEIRFDTAFNDVIRHCSAPRKKQRGTWITDEMMQAYIDLHQLGYAHSIESWLDNKLAGGLYGISIGKIFFGESMFSLERDASKVAFVSLVNFAKQHDFAMIDCQVESEHLNSLGATLIPRSKFVDILDDACRKETLLGPWNPFRM
ncbi:MAG: leucyl/phenylalanyl-tRNA--protein transferase [Gammaproteobacteria bacterium]|nr:leucyl/phenylalanyl-tRNA--protein transferase [Gammaproteobacteria bacterium]MDH5652258.1 leucyl/phenylalanyl-tRNA--protein transferase [Gammaproteobacteria bacterium]